MVQFSGARSLAPVFGQTPSPLKQQFVDLRVIAVDNKGNPVKDLTSNDFKVVDDGKEQKVALLRYNDTSVSQTPSPRPNEFSNRGSGEIPHATVILFDLLNEGTDEEVALDDIVQTLSKLGAGDYVYLYILTVDGRLFEVHGLPKTAEAPRSSGAEPWTRQIKPLMDQAMRTVKTLRQTAIDARVQVQITLQALNRLGTVLSTIPGYKSLVWITDGVPIYLGPRASGTNQPIDFTPVVMKLSAALDRLAITVYPTTANSFSLTNAALNDFATMTGGLHGKNIGTTITQAVENAQGAYLLGYYPPPQNWDDTFHKLSVSCTRKGVRIQTEMGYYAEAKSPEAQAQQAVDIVSSSDFDAPGIGMTARISRDSHDDTTGHIDLRIDAHDVALVPDGSSYVAQLQISVIHSLAAGGARRAPLVPLTLRYNPEQREDALNRGIDFDQDVPLGQNGDRLRFIVFDQGSNAVGSITIPITSIHSSTPE
jgi:VWFA-related protein